MGLKAPYIKYIEDSVNQVYGKDTHGLRMLELGDQVVTDPIIDEETGKEYFSNQGYEHISVDQNGLHGAVIRNLTKPKQFIDGHGSWDIITNMGTTEHIEPLESQYECFSILHDCIKIGGVMIHLLPDVKMHDEYGAWKNHCPFYYSESFFEILAKDCEYELLTNTVINGLRCSAIKKVKDAPFMQDRSKFVALIAQRDQEWSSGFVRNFLRKMGVGDFLRRLNLR